MKCQTTTGDVLGPFYRPNSPIREDLRSSHNLKALWIKGVVRCSATCQVIAGAKIEVWAANIQGEYDNDTDQFRNRGTVITSSEGRYQFLTDEPGYYSFEELDRARHLHLRITCSGYKDCVTQIYFFGDPRIAKDPFASLPDAHQRILKPKHQSKSKDLYEFDLALEPLSPSKQAQVEIPQIRLPISTKHYSTLGGLVTFLGLFYTVIHFIQINPLKSDLQRAKEEKAVAESNNTSLNQSLNRLEIKYETLVAGSKGTTLVHPANDIHLLGSDVTFQWNNPNHSEDSVYTIYLRRLQDKRSEEILLHVPNPAQQRRHTTFVGLAPGTYLWRVKNSQVKQNPNFKIPGWSTISTFEIYPDTISRVKATRRLLIATTPTTYGTLSRVNQTGSVSGFEMEMMAWLAERLGSEIGLGSSISIEIVPMPWKRIFPALQYGEVDLAARSITRSKKRERQFSGIRFTTSYLDINQVFIAHRPDLEYPKSLDNATVGVKNNSTNQEAAIYLSQDLGFTVDHSYINYGDIYEALRNGRVNFGLVDSVLASPMIKSGAIHQIGPFLDEKLKRFYNERLGFGNEAYSIAVFQPNPDGGLLAALNALMETDDFTSFLKALCKEYNIPQLKEDE